MAERIQKVLARSGLGSRREIERWITEGRLTINGKPAQIGAQLKGGERLAVDGKPVDWSSDETVARVLIYHKPEGEVVSRDDPEGHDSIFANLPELTLGRWIAVGRLDINTSGLLLVTNHGELAQRLMHPSRQFERVYATRVFGDFDADEAILQLKKGVELDDGTARFENILPRGGEGKNRWFECTLKEGRYREVRRLWQAVGGEVSRLMRTRYAGIMLPKNLSRGMFLDLTPNQVNQLMRDCELPEVDREESIRDSVNRFKRPTRARDLKPSKRDRKNKKR